MTEFNLNDLPMNLGRGVQNCISSHKTVCIDQYKLFCDQRYKYQYKMDG